MNLQQGDPLGPLLFCIAKHPVLSSLKSELKFAYLDDVNIGGKESIVSADVRMLEEECTKIGLQLNVSKCELISCQDSQLVSSPLSSFIRVKPDEAILLGAPLLSGSAMDSTLNKLNENLHWATQSLSLLT